MVLGQELRTSIHICRKEAERERKLGMTGVVKSQSPPPVTHFSNKATSPNNGTPYGPTIQTYESIWAVFIPTTTVDKLIYTSIYLNAYIICTY